MKHLSSTLRSARKRIAAGALIALAIALPVASTAAGTVKMEATTEVANATKASTWGSSTTATYNEVVAVQVVYNNTEDPSSDKVAENVRVKIDIPAKAGANQTINTKVSATNGNTVNGSSTVTLDREDAFLQYIPGTATWKYATTANGERTETKAISDDVVLNQNGIDLGNEDPCKSGSIVVQARVMVPGTKVVKEVEKANETNKWSQANTANPGETLKYRITYQNTGNSQAQNVIVRDNLPPKMVLVPNTTRVYSSLANGALDPSNGITNGGIDVGNPMPGAVIYVTFEAKLPAEAELECGDTTFRNIGIAHPKTENEYYNVAVTTVTKKCDENPQQPNDATYSCDAFEVTPDIDAMSAEVSDFQYTAANGAEFKHVVLDWGDGTDPLTTNTVVGQEHTYAEANDYTITATAHFTVEGQDVTAENCVATVSFANPANPNEELPVEEDEDVLPATGPAEVFAVIASAIVAGTVAHRVLLSRRQAR